jgi:hypothetical protein
MRWMTRRALYGCHLLGAFDQLTTVDDQATVSLLGEVAFYQVSPPVHSHLRTVTASSYPPIHSSVVYRYIFTTSTKSVNPPTLTQCTVAPSSTFTSFTRPPQPHIP